jgi:conjugal transfer/type IV secretion protein DotA/TraY
MKKLIIIIMLLFVSFAVNAQDSNYTPDSSDFEVEETDLGYRTIFKFFTGEGGLNDLSNSPISDFIGTFNGITLIFAGIIFLFHLIYLVFQFNEDPDNILKKNAFTALRTAIFSGLMIPLGAGFSAIQIIFLWLVLQGMGAANLLWTTYLETNSITASYNNVVADQDIYNLAYGMLKMNTCVITQNDITNKGSQVLNGRKELGIYKTTPLNYGFFYNYGQLDGSRGSFGSDSPCGQIKVDLASNKDFTGGEGFIDKYSDAQRTLKETVRNVRNTIEKEQIKQTEILNTKMKELSVYLIKNNTNNVFNSEYSVLDYIDEQVSTYKSAIQASASNAFKENYNQSEYVRLLAKDGWIVGGTFYFKQSMILEELHSSLSNSPSVNKMPQIDDSYENQLMKTRMGTIESHIQNRGVGASAKTAAAMNVSEQDNIASSGFGSTVFAKITSIIDNALDEYGEQGLWETVQQQNNMLFNVVYVGQLLERIAMDTGILALGAGAISFLPFIGDAIRSVVVAPTLSFANYFGFLGASYSVILPTIPYVLYLAAIIQYIMWMFMALLGVQLLAVSAVAPDTDGIVGKLGQWWMTIFKALFQAALIVAGLIVGLTIIYPATAIFNNTYFALVENLGGITSPWKFIVFMCLGWYLMYIIIKTCFSAIHIVPEDIPKWIGGIGERLGEPAKDMLNSGVMSAQSYVTNAAIASKAANKINPSPSRKGSNSTSGKTQKEGLSEAANKRVKLEKE